MTAPASLSLRIEALDGDGAGVATSEASAIHRHPLSVHVAGALPGERVTVRLEHVSPHRADGARHGWARLLSIDDASPDRTAPLCPAFGHCGGCPLQHITLARQLDWKHRQVRDAFANFTTLARVPVATCIGSPVTIGYRNQVRLVYGRTDKGRACLGAYAPRSHAVIDVAGCRLAEDPLEAVATTVRALVARAHLEPHDQGTGRGDLRHVALRASAAGRVLVTLVCAHEDSPTRAIVDDLVAAHQEIVGVVLNIHPAPGDAIFGSRDIPLWGHAALDDEIEGVRVALSSRGFFQLNRHVAALAYREIAAHARAGGPFNHAVEAYAGVAVIGRLLSAHARAVTAIESNPAAAPVDHDPGSTPHPGVSYRIADAAAGLRTLGAADFIVLNPPRAGCAAEVLAEVARLGPAAIAYLSCNPRTLARDLDGLVRSGFAIDRVQPFDMLPHTAHVETLVFLHSSR